MTLFLPQIATHSADCFEETVIDTDEVMQSVYFFTCRFVNCLQTRLTLNTISVGLDLYPHL